MNIVEEIRKKTGLSIIQIAKKTGISRDAIYKIEKGISKPNFDTLEKLKESFGINNNMISLKYFPDVLASAGNGCFVNNENFEPINIDKKQLLEMGIKSNFENIVVIRASGYSMQPTIQDRDLLFVDITKKEIYNNKIYIISENNDLKVKRLLRKTPFDKNIIVKSDNEIDGEYPPYVLDLNDKEKANCIKGQVIFYCRSIE